MEEVKIPVLFEGQQHDEEDNIVFDFNVFGKDGEYACLIYRFTPDKVDRIPQAIAVITKQVNEHEDVKEVKKLAFIGTKTPPPGNENYEEDAESWNIKYTMDDEGIRVDEVVEL